MRLWTLAMAAVLVAASAEADAARRLGGGQSVGKQSSSVSQREAGAAPAQPAPAGTQVAQKSPAPTAAAAPAQPARSRFGGMMAGLAAGLGLAWLAHTLGFGEAFANVLLFALLGVAIAIALAWFFRSRGGVAQAAAGPYAYQSAGPSPDTTTMPRQYNPEKVGNDASARPWERSSMAFEPARHAGGGVQIGSSLGGSQGWGIPPGFDAQGFVEAARRNYVTLQAAWDRGDLQALRGMMTDEMSAEIGRQLAARPQPTQPAQATEVVMLEARLLGIEEQAGEYMASVEFSGMVREEAGAGPSPFREVWNMTKPKSGESGWLVAGVQALQ